MKQLSLALILFALLAIVVGCAGSTPTAAPNTVASVASPAASG